MTYWKKKKTIQREIDQFYEVKFELKVSLPRDKKRELGRRRRSMELYCSLIVIVAT